MAGAPARSLRADGGVVLRTPALPMDLPAWAAAADPRAYLAELLGRADVREAIYVASPGLSDAIASWRAAPGTPANRRVEVALAKYVARMMGRATPFGLFSAVSTGTLGRETALALAPRAEYGRRTRLDNDYLFVLADELARPAAARAALTYRPNTSIYRVAGRLRYAAAHVVGKERSYQLVAVDLTPYVEAVLARAGGGARRADLVATLVSDEISAAEAEAFVDEMIDAQLLVPDLGVHVTGPEPLDGLIAQLAAAGLEEPRAVLVDVRARLAALDAGGVGHAPEAYTAIADALRPLGAAVDLARLFQVDMSKPATATVSTRVAADLARTAAQLARIIPREDRTFDEFKRAFAERYEGRTVPLAEVLDEETGIGFEAARGPGSEGAPLLAGLAFPGRPAEARAHWSAFERHMLDRLATALAAGHAEIVLGDADLTAMAVPEPAPMPDAVSITCRLGAAASPGGPPQILFDGTNGPSGARILGRFSGASPAIEAMVRAHHAAEEALRPDAVFAEIVHLNEGRIGNILCRPVLRAHELVFLGVSGAPRDAQIVLDDLDVTVRGDRIVLTSRRLGREIVPRLTTAHNFRLRSLGVYRFLCALAGQGVMGVGWTWSALGTAPRLPRVRLGDVVVARARWRLTPEELAPIKRAVRAAQKDPTQQGAVLTAVAELRTQRDLPRMFAIAAADNELPIDLDNPLLAAAFADEVAVDYAIELVELFPAPDALAVHGPEGGYANEVVLLYTRTGDPAAAPPRAPPSPTVRRTFPPGSEWLYAKVYCGEATADRVLAEAIGPVARAARAAGDAQRWFFLRYHDPEPHVRVRFAGEPAALLGRVVPALAEALTPLAEQGAVRHWVLDTYTRELERYGGDRGIALVEDVFWRDSEAVLGIVELLEGDEGAKARWQLAIRGIDSLLAGAGLPPERRARICADGRDMIGREHRAGTPLWTQLGERFTRDRAALEAMFTPDPARDAEHDFAPGLAILAERDAALAPIFAELRAADAAGALAPTLDGFAWSLVHMHANRMLHASQRAQEMVLYDFVRRLHAAQRARAR